MPLSTHTLNCDSWIETRWWWYASSGHSPKLLREGKLSGNGSNFVERGVTREQEDGRDAYIESLPSLATKVAPSDLRP